jgi:O-antigen/teichoic acid export membrane protein
MVLSRALRDRVGQYDLARNLTVLWATTFSLGLGNASVFLLNGLGHSYTRVGTMVGQFVAWATVGSSGALLIFLAVFPGYLGVLSTSSVLLLALGTASLLGFVSLRSLLLARMQALQLVLVDCASPAFVLLGASLLWHLGVLDGPGAISLFGCGQTLAFVLVGLLTLRTLPFTLSIDLGLFALALRHGMKLYLSNIVLLLGSSLVLFLLRAATMASGEFGPVAYFTRASALCGLASVLPLTAGPLLYAKWSGKQDHQRSVEVEFAARLHVLYGVFSTIVLWVLGPILLRILYGPDFGSAQSIVLVLAPSGALFGLCGVFNNLFASLGRAELSALLFCVGALVSGAVALAFGSSLDGVGAAVSILVGNVFATFAGFLLGRRTSSVNWRYCIVPRASDLRFVRSLLIGNT